MTTALVTRDAVFSLMRTVAAELSQLTPEKYGAAMEFLKSLEEAAEGLKTTLGARVKEEVRANGHQVTDKGTTEWVVGGYVLRAIPTRTGVDPKKLEARLRAKGREPSLCMDATIAFKVNEGKLAAAVERGDLTAEEVAACKYDLNFRLEAEREKTGE